MTAVIVCAEPVWAQRDSSLAMGLAVSRTDPTDARASSTVEPGLLIRLRRTNGFGFAMGLSWFSTVARTTVAGQQETLGKLNIRPVLFGASYGRQFSGVKWDVSLVGGYAFVNIRDTGRAKRAYETALDARDVGLRASGTLAWRTNFSLWREIGHRWGVLASVGYLGVQPEVATRTSAGTFRERVNAGSVVTTVGVAYGIF